MNYNIKNFYLIYLMVNKSFFVLLVENCENVTRKGYLKDLFL
jgi:hypothetical protein